MSRLDFDDDSMSIVVGVADAKADAHPLVVQARDVYQHVREVLVVGECCEASLPDGPAMASLSASEASSPALVAPSEASDEADSLHASTRHPIGCKHENGHLLITQHR